MKRHAFGALTALLLLLSVCFLTADGLLGLTEPTVGTFPIPDLVGKTEQEVAALDGFSVISVYEQDDSPAGTVLAQEPAAGSLRRKTDRPTELRLTVSLGRKRVVIPALSGKTADEATSVLRALGLTVTQQRLPGGHAGEVERTEPSAGAEVLPDSAVTLYVRAGEATRTVSVPDLRGMSRGEALLLIFRAGLSVEVEEANRTDETGGTNGADETGRMDEADRAEGTNSPDPNPAAPFSPVVLAQSPAPGSIVLLGTPVRITLGAKAQARNAVP